MWKSRSLKKCLLTLGALLLLALLLLAAAPLWLPWLLGSVSQRFGLNYSRYEREGYGRFSLVDAEYQQEGMSFTSDRLRLYFPTVWLWRHYGFASKDGPAYVEVADWKLTLKMTNEEQPPQKPVSTPSVTETLHETESILKQLQAWIPRADFIDGTIEAAGQTVKIPKMKWQNGSLTAETLLPKWDQQVTVLGDVRDGMPYRLVVHAPGIELSSTNHLYETNSAVALEGTVVWLTNRVELSAMFRPSDRLPNTATVRASSFRVPAEKASLRGYEDLTGSLLFEWRDERFEFDLQAHAAPDPDDRMATPVDLNLQAEGTTNRVRISSAQITAPWLTTEISEGVELVLSGGQILSTQAVVRVEADLAKQPWIEATGQIGGDAVLRPSTNRIPEVQFELAGRGVAKGRLQTEQLRLAGTLNWPVLRLNPVRLELLEGTVAEAQGAADLALQTISNLTVRVNGPLSSNLVPAGIRLQNTSVELTASGPLSNLTHSGKVKLSGLKLARSGFMGVEAEWQGEQLAVKRFKAELKARDSVLAVSGTAEWHTNRAFARVEAMPLTSGEVPILKLEKPFELSLRRTDGPPSGTWQAVLDPVSWRGGGRALSLSGGVAWPAGGEFAVAVENIRAGLFDDFFAKPLPNIEVEQFQSSGKWTNGPLHLALDGTARYRSEEGPYYAAHINAQSNGEGIRIAALEVTTEQIAVVRGEGNIPMTVEPAGGARLLVLHTNRPVHLRLATAPNDLFWDRIWKLTGIGLQTPRIELQVAGSIEAPRGSMTIELDQVRPDRFQQGRELPPLRDVRAQIDIRPEAIDLKRLAFSINGETVETSARLPLNAAFPGAMTSDHNQSPLPTNGFHWRKLLDFDALTASVQMHDADLAKVAAPFFPETLSPHGKVDVDLQVLPEKRLGGHVTVRGAATRPMLPIGVIDDIQARFDFVDRQVQIDHFRGKLGGEPFAVTGQVNLANRVEGGLPEFNLKLRGTNLPLMRSPALILRSNLDVGLVNASNGPPVVVGEVELQKSYYLSDLRDLIPGGVIRPEQRPPYFSIDAEPVKNWRFDLRVRGEDFLQVRTPLFRGLVSAHLKLEGTFVEPLALGDVKVDSGMVLFPFANVRVRQGIVSLTSERPHQPELFVIATERVFGYDVRIEVRGPVQEPVIEFSSTPALSSEEIVLMLTAGQLPQQGPALGNRQRATRLGLFLGKGLISKFGGGEGSADRLTIRTGENISEQGKETYSAEYKLSENWSVVGEYDRFNDFNLGVKWRIYSR